jgi:hypothetical protein
VDASIGSLLHSPLFSIALFPLPLTPALFSLRLALPPFLVETHVDAYVSISLSALCSLSPLAFLPPHLLSSLTLHTLFTALPFRL